MGALPASGTASDQSAFETAAKVVPADLSIVPEDAGSGQETLGGEPDPDSVEPGND